MWTPTNTTHKDRETRAMRAGKTNINPKSIKLSLRALEGEVESRSEALPPDDKTLRDWTTQAKQIYRQARQLRGQPRRSLMYACRELGERLIGLQQERESYREFNKHVQANIDGLLHGSQARLRALPAAISGALSYRESGHTPTALAPEARAADAFGSQPDEEQAPPPADIEQVAAAMPAGRAAQKVAPGPASAPQVPATAHEVTETANRPARVRADQEPTYAIPFHVSLRTDPIIAYIGRLDRPHSFEQACEIACRWLTRKHFKLPAATNKDFEVEGRYGSKAIVIHERGIWAMQAETPDARVDGRCWRVEMVLVEDPAAAPAVSITLSAIGPADQPVPDPTVPGLAGDLIDNIGLIDLQDGSRLSTQPTMINTPDEVQRLVYQLESPQRQHPIIVLSEYRMNGMVKTMLDARGLASKLRGLAHVMVLGLEHRASWALTDHLSKRFSVFGAAVRLFRPRFTTEDAPTDHPFWTPRVLEARALRLQDVGTQLLRESASSSLRVLESRDAIPVFDDVQKAVLTRRIEQMRKRAMATSATASASTRIIELEEALHDANDLADLFAKDKDALSARVNQLTRERDSLKSKLIYFQDRVRTFEQWQVTAPADAVAVIPDTWEDLEGWADEHLGDRVILTPKAVRAARNSSFADISFAYQVLLFLANTYVASKRGELDDGKHLLDAAAAELGINVGLVGRAPSAHRSKDTYSTTYRGTRVPLDMHVQGSSNRDPRYGFRLYFHWDPQDQCVVVGWFPGHLNNTLS